MWCAAGAAATASCARQFAREKTVAVAAPGLHSGRVRSRALQNCSARLGLFRARLFARAIQTASRAKRPTLSGTSSPPSLPSIRPPMP